MSWLTFFFPHLFQKSGLNVKKRVFRFNIVVPQHWLNRLGPEGGRILWSCYFLPFSSWIDKSRRLSSLDSPEMYFSCSYTISNTGMDRTASPCPPRDSSRHFTSYYQLRQPWGVRYLPASADPRECKLLGSLRNVLMLSTSHRLHCTPQSHPRLSCFLCPGKLE